MDYYIVNLSHLKATDKYVTVWRPECKGYAWPLSWAGRYAEEEVLAHLDYYNSGDNIAVPCSILEGMAIAPAAGDIDNNAGPVVLNNAETWRVILPAVIVPPVHPAKPKYRKTA